MNLKDSVNCTLLVVEVAVVATVNPSDTLAVFPDASSITAILSVDALTMLLSILPPAFVLLSVVPGVDSVSVFSIILVLTFVHSAVFPGVNTFTVHIIVSPLAVILSAIRPHVDTFAVDLVLAPFSFVHASVVPDVLAVSVLHALLVASLVLGAILPGFHALAVLEVVLPVAFVLGTVDVNVDSITIGFVILPLTFIDVSVSVPELSTAIGLVFSPFALVLGVVRPDLNTRSVTHVVQEVAAVDGTVLKGQLLDELKSLFGGISLELHKIRIISCKELWESISGLIVVLWSAGPVLVVLGESGVSVVINLVLSLVVVRSKLVVFDLDFTVLFGRVNASASISHISNKLKI